LPELLLLLRLRLRAEKSAAAAAAATAAESSAEGGAALSVVAPLLCHAPAPGSRLRGCD